MQLHNETPLSPFVFETLGPHDEPWHVVICRGTFDIHRNGQLTLSAEQQPVVLADKYRTSPLVSSVEIDTDLVPYKAATDITLNAMAQSPEGILPIQLLSERADERWPPNMTLTEQTNTRLFR